MLKTFAEMINQCGGINGRQIDLNVIQAQGAGDQATTLANAQADCIKATEDYKAFIVITWAAFAAPPCITDDHKTLLLSGTRHAGGVPEDRARAATSCSGRRTRSRSTRRPMLDLIKSGKLKGKKVAVLYPTFTTGVDLVKANVIDLLKSKGVNVVQAEALTPDPSGDISSQYPLVVGRLKSNGVDTLITSSAGGNTFRFSALTKELRNQGLEKAVTLYSLDAPLRRGDRPQPSGRRRRRRQAHQRHEHLRVLGGGPAGLAGRRDRRRRWSRSATRTTTRPRPSRRTSCREPAPPAFARDPYGTVGLICAMYRTHGARALQRGPEPHPEVGDQGVRGAAVPRQRRGQGLTAAARRRRSSTTCRRRCSTRRCSNKAEYPCAHPSLPPDAANYRICLVPQPGYDKGGKAMSGPFFVDKN